MTGKRIYIAGPYTMGRVEDNVARAICAAEEVAKLGHYPFIPHLSHYWNEMFEHPYSFWTGWDDEWLKVCDAVLRIPGQSPGADAEEALAKSLGIAVFYNLDDLRRMC